MYDLRPPDSAFAVAFGHPDLVTVWKPGAPPILGATMVVLPPRGEYDNIGDAALLDVMTTVAFRVAEVGDHCPVGTLVEVPGRAAPWTVRKVYAERDDLPPSGNGWVLVGVA